MYIRFVPYVTRTRPSLTNRTANLLVNRAARLLGRIAEPRLRELGLSVAQLPVLGALERGGSLPQKELAHSARLEQPTMTELLARMKRAGLVRTAANPVDGRSQLVSLTRAATSKLAKVHALQLRANREALTGFSAAEAETLRVLLGRVVANLERVADV